MKNINKISNNDNNNNKINNINKASASKECNICHYWYFLDKGFRFRPYLFSSCNDVLIMSVKLNDIAILNINTGDYCCIINGISKNDAVNLIQNANLTEMRRLF